MTEIVGRLPLGVLLLSGALFLPKEAKAQNACDHAATSVALTAVIAAATGTVGALSSSGLAAELDDTRDFSFSQGALIGAGVSTGLAGIYALFDGTSACRMAEDGIAWSVPITTFLIGAALPIAIWGASDELGPVQSDQAALSPATRPAPRIRLRWRF